MTTPTETPRKSTMQQLAERIAGAPLEETLRKLYVEQRHSDAAIAAALGVSRSTVRMWRAQFGITRDAPAAIQLPVAAA